MLLSSVFSAFFVVKTLLHGTLTRSHLLPQYQATNKNPFDVNIFCFNYFLTTKNAENTKGRIQSVLTRNRRPIWNSDFSNAENHVRTLVVREIYLLTICSYFLCSLRSLWLKNLSLERFHGCLFSAYINLQTKTRSTPRAPGRIFPKVSWGPVTHFRWGHNLSSRPTPWLRCPLRRRAHG